ncbi:halocyanin domain-containing protein [Haloferax sp. DFSO52]|uniref:halocyanin domain-containing protein n=1 Tax=Haloferax sp. DFSO52 TaxID=3388505 RepID=UPI003A8B0C59
MTTNEPTSPTVGRRTALRLLGGAAVSGTALGHLTTTASAQSDGTAIDSWLEDTSNYDGIVDKTGSSNVTVEVGTDANGGAFGFGPAAVRVDPGTTIVWEWTGDGGVHDVTADDGSFKSDLIGEAGHTFEQTFDGEGVVKYACSPHAGLGMKGAIVVGGGNQSNSTTKSSGDSKESDVNLESWFENTSNYDGVTNQTGRKRVTVEVGTAANNGAFGFGPAAIRVSKGTTVVWKWTGNGGSHNVVAEDGGFESELVSEGGLTFERTFDETGTVTYACTPHKTLGMKGAVVVTADEGGPNAEIAEPFDDPEMETLGGFALAGTFGVALASPALFGVFLRLKGDDESGELRANEKSE